MDRKLHIGIIGCGGIANGKHMPSLKKIDTVEMVAFCDIVRERAEKAAKENGIPPKTFSTEALNHLSGYEWPGNIRQLQNVVERCLVLVPGDVITLEDLPAEIRDEEAQFKSAVDLLPVQLDLADTLERIEAALIRRALVRADFVQAKAAELLGISKSLMQYKLKKYSITGH